MCPTSFSYLLPGHSLNSRHRQFLNVKVKICNRIRTTGQTSKNLNKLINIKYSLNRIKVNIVIHSELQMSLSALEALLKNYFASIVNTRAALVLKSKAEADLLAMVT